MPPRAKPPKIRVTVSVNDLLAQVYLGGQRFEYLHASLADKANELTDDVGPFLRARRRYSASKISIARTVNEDVLFEIAATFRKGEGEGAR